MPRSLPIHFHMLISGLLAAPGLLHAQTTWNVDAGGSTLSPPAPYYTPQDLTINLGDIVTWHITSGTHNIDGRQSTFPTNPATFYSGTPQNTPNTWSFTFTVPGFYQYHCNQQGHSTTQHGTITVLDPNGVLPIGTPGPINIYPVPAGDELVLSIFGCTNAAWAEVISPNGQVVRELGVVDNSLNRIHLGGLPGGQYYLLIRRGTTEKPIMKAFVKL